MSPEKVSAGRGTASGDLRASQAAARIYIPRFLLWVSRIGRCAAETKDTMPSIVCQSPIIVGLEPVDPD